MKMPALYVSHAQEAGRVKAREGSLLHAMGCMLYWAEGAKDRNQLNFVNSNSGMMLMFVRFLKEEMGVNPQTEIAIRIHCHSNEPTEMQRVEQYWLSLLSLPQEALRKTIFKQGSVTSKKVLPNGVCSIRVKRSTYLTQHIFGAVQEYSKYEMPELLL
ncbi:MAG: hypothetical protein HC828_19025 [Blastochloris sp.]|nr:hypothetical protein [Blastochloris sp.]